MQFGTLQTHCMSATYLTLNRANIRDSDPSHFTQRILDQSHFTWQMWIFQIYSMSQKHPFKDFQVGVDNIFRNCYKFYKLEARQYLQNCLKQPGMCKNHGSLANFRRKIRTIVFIFKLETKHLNVRSTTKTVLRVSQKK